jgi:hypothetical protein
MLRCENLLKKRHLLNTVGPLTGNSARRASRMVVNALDSIAGHAHPCWKCVSSPSCPGFGSDHRNAPIHWYLSERLPLPRRLCEPYRRQKARAKRRPHPPEFSLQPPCIVSHARRAGSATPSCRPPRQQSPRLLRLVPVRLHYHFPGPPGPKPAPEVGLPVVCRVSYDYQEVTISAPA